MIRLDSAAAARRVLFSELSKARQLSLRVLIRNRSCLEKVGLHLQGV
jgi:hypothetical protein